MSRRLVETALPGYQGPVYVSTEELQNLLEGQQLDQLHEICQELSRYIHFYQPDTSDGYHWLWAGRFSAPSGFGEIVLMIPFARDGVKSDGSQFDRAVACYVTRKVTVAEIEAILRQFYDKLVETFGKRETATLTEEVERAMGP